MANAGNCKCGIAPDRDPKGVTRRTFIFVKAPTLGPVSYRILGFLKCGMTNAIRCRCGFARGSGPKGGGRVDMYGSWSMLGGGDHQTWQTAYVWMTASVMRWPRMVISREGGVDIAHEC